MQCEVLTFQTKQFSSPWATEDQGDADEEKDEEEEEEEMVKDQLAANKPVVCLPLD